MRSLAVFVDVLLLVVIGGVMQVIAEARGGFEIDFRQQTVKLDELLFFFLAILLTTFECFGDASIGKLVCGLRIGSITGGRARAPRRVIRWLIKTSPLLLFGVALAWQTTFQILKPMARTRAPETIGTIAAAVFAMLLASYSAVTRSKRLALYDTLTRTAVYPIASRHDDEERGFAPLIKRI